MINAHFGKNFAQNGTIRVIIQDNSKWKNPTPWLNFFWFFS